MTKLFYRDGQIVEYKDQTLAYEIWLASPKGIRIAFRGEGNEEPIYPWDFADKP